MLRSMYFHVRKYSLVYLGLVIYLLFFVSVASTGWFDFLFSGAAMHVGAKGIDFYQVPRGAWAFWHGGSMTGDPLADGSQYGKDFFANGNVYHPVFTLTFGSFLTLFDPAQAPYVWLWIKLPLSLLVIAYFFWSFRESKHVSFATFILLANFSIYLELAAWQFHFVLNMLIMLLLIALVKRLSSTVGAFWYWLGLLVKPIGLLFVPVLLFKGRWKVVVLGVALFILSTLAFSIHGTGDYYTNNLLANLSTSGTSGPNQIITFSALLHYITKWPDIVYKAIQYIPLLIILFLSALKRIPIAKAVLLYVAYYLCFYEQVFEYQWSTLAYVLAVCVVTCAAFQTRIAKFCILLTCLPDCFALLNAWHIDVKDLGYLGMIPGAVAWEWMVLSKLIPLFLVLICGLFADVKPIFRQVKALWFALYKVNEQLDMFGDEPASREPSDKENLAEHQEITS
ncbi:MAG TPA: hypothetical protein VFN35_30425, partial [Ktedonobacteraceae bacterium]|nr:hypothetical protein [Ktedonobacteraceae bacterium]